MAESAGANDDEVMRQLELTAARRLGVRGDRQIYRRGQNDAFLRDRRRANKRRVSRRGAALIGRDPAADPPPIRHPMPETRQMP